MWSEIQKDTYLSQYVRKRFLRGGFIIDTSTGPWKVKREGDVVICTPRKRSVTLIGNDGGRIQVMQGDRELSDKQSASFPVYPEGCIVVFSDSGRPRFSFKKE